LSADANSGPTRLETRLSELKAANTKALVTFITAGDPQPSCTVSAMHALVAGGADVIELGVPFSDPEAEGPAIQVSSERALAHGVTLSQVLDMVREFRNQDKETPIVLMGYLNSVLRMGEHSYAAAAQDAGVDGLIMVNLPPEEADLLQKELLQHRQNLIFLVAPTTTPERAEQILKAASGFVYYVSLKGITGASNLDPEAVRAKVTSLQARTALPVFVGFGIKDGDTAKAIRLKAQVSELRIALDSLPADG